MKINSLVGTISVCAFAIFTTNLSGCGAAKPTGYVKGKVTFKGEAVPEAVVQVQGVASGDAGTAKTDASGNYSISTPLSPGKYTAAVTPFEVPPPAPAPKDYKPKDDPKIPKKFRNAGSSGLTFEAKAGANEFNIQMADK